MARLVMKRTMPATIGEESRRRFWSYVKQTEGCWLWTGGVVKGRKGFDYGCMSIKGHQPRAHRIAWAISFGPIPDKMQVLHRCDNPLCVRPDHLFLGTQRDNILDAKAKGRNGTGRGEQGGNAKLKQGDVEIIRSLRKGPWPATCAAIANAFEMSETQTKRILNGESWAHI